MGTPALLTIVTDATEPEGVMHFRRHYDVYPEHVLPNLAPVLERIRAIEENDGYGLRIADVAALVAWVGVEENNAYNLQAIKGKLTTWRPISDNAAQNGYFCHAYTLNLNTLALTQDY